MLLSYFNNVLTLVNCVNVLDRSPGYAHCAHAVGKLRLSSCCKDMLRSKPSVVSAEAICLPHHPTHTVTSLWSCCGASHQHCFCALILPPVIKVPLLFRLRDGGASRYLYYALYIIIFTCYYHGASHHLLYPIILEFVWLLPNTGVLTQVIILQLDRQIFY